MLRVPQLVNNSTRPHTYFYVQSNALPNTPKDCSNIPELASSIILSLFVGWHILIWRSFRIYVPRVEIQIDDRNEPICIKCSISKRSVQPLMPQHLMFIRCSWNVRQVPLPTACDSCCSGRSPPSPLSAEALPGPSFWPFQISTCHHFSVCLLLC